MRTRMESYLSAGLREAGMVSGDYALLSLLTVEGQLTPARDTTERMLVGYERDRLHGRGSDPPLDRAELRGELVVIRVDVEG
jgi:hypothetical protein